MAHAQHYSMLVTEDIRLQLVFNAAVAFHAQYDDLFFQNVTKHLLP